MFKFYLDKLAAYDKCPCMNMIYNFKMISIFSNALLSLKKRRKL